MKVLVTGGAGFIGSHLTEKLLAQGDEVSCLDDLSTGRLENLGAVLEHPAFHMHVGSALEEKRVAALVEAADQVFHLAASVGVKRVVAHPSEAIETNVGSTRAVLQAAARDRTPVLFTSSSEVYGKGLRVPFREDDDLCLGPTKRSRWAYACSKALDEWLGLAYHRERGLPFTVARLFNTVGPRQVGLHGMVLPTLARQALLGEPLSVHGTGEQTRCFSHVADTAEALVRLARCDDAHGEVVNVGSDEEITIASLAERVRTLAKSPSQILFVPYEEAYGDGFEDMQRRVPCLDKLETLCRFRPRTSLDQTIRDVLDSERAALSIAS